MQLKYTWLPDSLPDNKNPLHVARAHGSHLILTNGKPIYDAISSWWCKPLGHCHPLVAKSIQTQLGLFEHHIVANAYNDIIETLSSQLINVFTEMDKVVYASDGSSATEIAMKLSYEVRVLTNQPERNKFIALTNAYHGETIFALSVCGITGYKSTYQSLLPQNYFIEDIPYVNSRSDPIWSDCNFDENKFEQLLCKLSLECTALIIEPVVQGAAGLKIISRDFLCKLIKIAKNYDIHIISDEIMVGLGRLGCYSVSKEILDFEPEFVCFGKNLTAGAIPMSAVVVKKTITEQFRIHKHNFTHSHTHSCNALGASVAVSYLDLLKTSVFLADVISLEGKLLLMMQNFAKEFDFVANSRAIASIAACNLNLSKDKIAAIFAIGIKNEIYLRPIGNVLYVMPPLYNLANELDEINDKLYKVLLAVQK